jgi:SWI/SNF-related matrix-associated actin-dependent regulator 1 of chromatin subfamily A
MPKREFDFRPRSTPFPHQLDAVTFIHSRPAVAIFDEQGLGKTKIVLDALLAEIRDGLLDGALIVCRKSLLFTWKSEIEKHTRLPCVILTGAARTLGARYLVFSHFYLTSYTIVPSEFQRLKRLLELRRFAIVLDESHAIKNPMGKTTQFVTQLSPLAIKRIILTGTPIANYPEDLWSQFFFLDGGTTLGDDFRYFTLKYELGSGPGRREVPLESLNEISDQIRGVSLRRTKKQVLELPEKTFHVSATKLTGRQAEMYRQVKTELRLELLSNRGGYVMSLDNVFERLLRLVQVASNPALVDPAYGELPAKFVRLDEVLQEIAKRHEKAVVWSQFVQNVQVLARRYRDHGSTQIHGGIRVEKRFDAVARFQEDPECRLLFAVPGAAREGLTLTAANHAIYVDRNFNLVDYLQSQDRIHRIGQQKPCRILKIVAEETVDVFVEEVLLRKAAIAGTVQDGVEAAKDVRILREGDLEDVLGKVSDR